MDLLNKVAIEVFNNKESYTTNDYMVIMANLKEQYHKIKGDLPSSYQIVKEEVIVCECCGEASDIYDNDMCVDCYWEKDSEAEKQREEEEAEEEEYYNELY